jgi:hypothetical protein
MATGDPINGSGYRDLCDRCRESGLSVPPIPESLRPSLARRGEWCWATRDVDPMAMYFFRQYVAEVVAQPVEDYVAVSHAGHGVNSYSLNYHLVLGPLAVFAQDSWGGVYTNPEQAAGEIRHTHELIQLLLDALPPGSRQPPRLVLLWSSFRDNHQLAVIDTSQSSSVSSWHHKGPFSGMGWSPASRADGLAVSWTDHGDKRALFTAARDLLVQSLSSRD